MPPRLISVCALRSLVLISISLFESSWVCTEVGGRLFLFYPLAVVCYDELKAEAIFLDFARTPPELYDYLIFLDISIV